jgi:predicted HTH domain antitoxin
MTEVIIKLPDTLALALGATPEARSRRLAEDAAIEEYRIGHLTQRQVGEMLGLDYWQTERFLAARHVPLNYSLADLQSDQATLNDALDKQRAPLFRTPLPCTT